MSWRKLDGTRILLPIAQAVENTIEAELQAGHQLRICIGTDSQVYGPSVSFATVIAFIRQGRGGFMFINNEHIQQSFSLRERMITEVSKSIAIAYELADLLSLYHIPLEIHADINTDAAFKSNLALKEAMGYIRGMGYEFKAKPHAFASSSCADKAC